METMTRAHVPVELLQPTRYDAVAAVVYRVGQPFHPLDPATWGDAGHDALVPRTIPRLNSDHRRWVVCAFVETPADAALPLHQRPALNRALGVSLLLKGGIVLERLADLGPDDAASTAALQWMVEHSGRTAWEIGRDVQTSPDETGAVTVGYLSSAPFPRRTHSDRDPHTIARRVRSIIDGRLARLPWEALAEPYRLLDDAARAALDGLARDGEVQFPVGRAMSSSFHDDLTYPSAVQTAQRLRAQGMTRRSVEHALALSGFVNASGHRTWNQSLVQQVLGQS